MHFTNFLTKYFDVEINTEFDPSSESNLTKIWLYEKGEDCEPVLILTQVYNVSGAWRIGNVSSKLEHDTQMQEKELRHVVKSGSYKK
ncbi:hypothetical protein [Pectobacterium carotovorum]|uniref:hypothetical protein n=1 Tax=Pectobacterium carotovorum TaxID=554 RepID=UPI000503E255|nr:hypothetical protein [Pectobacterium carotovorum]KFW97593.1 hypothetical protein JV33_21575 [Pectobacterium carotovorum subsp. carotovorum]KML64935.1 hypothetical protein G032_20950 [Pectobacterium carotovorum subsp. carotovorum ICMP 5702]SHH67950.1 hypothetical protein SAMN05444147_1162 [Pectobacterium carotovorum]